MSAYSKIACPHCDKTLKVPEELAGKTRTCPYCRGSVKIPGGPSPSSLSGMAFPNVSAGDSSSSGSEASSSNGAGGQNGWSNHGGESASSDVSLVLSGIMGLVMMVVVYALLYPLRQFLIGKLFWDRGFIPFMTSFLFFWSVGILILKWKHAKRQKESMLLDVLPTEISEEITIKSLDKFVKHIYSLPGVSSQSFLINRVLRGIEHFRVRKSAAETVTMMESQSAIDSNNVAGSYSIIKVFIWSLPILGFIGTVIGLSAAVSSLAASLSSATDMTAMKEAMNSVFSGLGTAFDTTLLALIMSMIVKIPTSAMQKNEEDLITSVDEYCNENFLRRLNDGREGGAERGASGGASVFREAVEAAMGTQHAELEKWLAKLDGVGGKLTTQLAEGWEKVGTRLQKQQQQHSAALQEQQVKQQEQLQEQLLRMTESAAEIQTALSNVATEAGNMHSQVNGSFSEAQAILQERFQGLESGLNSLSTVLEKLGEQSVVVQQVAVPEAVPVAKKNGWFRRRSRY